MEKPNPKGTMFVELIAKLMDLLSDRNVSRIEVVMASYESDDNVATRPFIVRGMGKEVQEELRTEFDNGPFTLLMVLWIDQTRPGGPGMFFFDPADRKRAPGIDGMDHLEKTVMADYLNRQVKKK
jgi:hypothetical protein